MHFLPRAAPFAAASMLPLLRGPAGIVHQAAIRTNSSRRVRVCNHDEKDHRPPACANMASRALARISRARGEKGGGRKEEWRGRAKWKAVG